MKLRTKKFMKWFLTTSLLLAALVNLQAFLHAGAMTRWSDNRNITQGPEDLSWIQRLHVLTTGVKIPRPVNDRAPDSIGLHFSTHRLPNGQGEELEAWHITAAESEVLIVLFHGYAASKASLLTEAKALHDLGYATLLVDFYGSGGSSGRHTTLGVREALDVEAVVRFARRHWPDQAMVLYGQSMGGAAVLRAVDRQGVSPDGIVLEAVYDQLLTTVQARFRSMKLPPTPMAQLLIFWGGVAAGFDGFDHNPAEYASAVACPALVFHGRRDPRVSTHEAQAVFAELGDWKRFLEIESAGHGSTVEAGPEEWKREVVLLVKQVLADNQNFREN